LRTISKSNLLYIPLPPLTSLYPLLPPPVPPEINPEEAALVEVFGNLDISDHLLSELSPPPLSGESTTELAGKLTDELTDELTENLALLETNFSDPVGLAPPAPPEILNPEPRNFERPQTSLSLRVDLEQLEHQNYLAGELLINQNQLTLQGEQVEETVQKLFGWLQQHRQTIGKLKKQLVRDQGLEIPEVTDLMDTILEETVQLEQATADLNLFSQNGQQFVEREQRLLKQVRESMQQIRMMPVGNVLNRLALITQQLTNAYNKPVEIKLQGLDVLIDKAIAESLYEALLHLVRNAFAHGIESPEVRRHHQKPEVGTIEVSAYNQGNRTVIEVRDDGAGLDVDRIVSTAIAQKLLTPAQGNHLKNLPQPEPQILDLLCSPGMSTKDDVNDLAGRGIGLNVVRSQLQHIRGNLFLQSQRHQGTTFSLQIQGSLMSTRLLSCRAGGRIYTFVANEITQTLMPFAENIKSVGEQKILDWHDGSKSVSVPLYNLSELFEYADPKLPTTDVEAPELTPLLTPRQGRIPVLLLPKGSGFVGLEVDQVIEEQELVIKPIPAAIPSPEYIYGCTVLADGSMTLVIDGVELINYTAATLRDSTIAKSSGERVELLGEPPIADPISKVWRGNSPEPSILQGKGYSNEELTDVTTGKKLSYGKEALGQFDKSTLKPSDRGVSEGRQSGEFPRLPQAKAPAKTTILIVDDSITERQKLSLVLQKGGFQVQQAKDGVDALDQLQKNLAIPLIICDLEMPRMTGFEFLSVTRQQPHLAKIPVIMLTSRGSAQYQQIARSLGAIAYFTKPYLDYQLLAKVKEILASQ
ncbi:MAG: response regulator, partial [Coleofasciculaceae cyanobacterium SM2_1_6]|nr:response regulator [Coleofasciculaceae cyanobacterium SM2_1_6]